MRGKNAEGTAAGNLAYEIVLWTLDLLLLVVVGIAGIIFPTLPGHVLIFDADGRPGRAPMRPDLALQSSASKSANA